MRFASNSAGPTTTPTTVDVLIIGAGPAGATAACVLAARHSIVLVDRHPEPPFRIGESLIGAARPLLRDLGLLKRFEAAGHLPSFGQASAWGTHELERRDSFLDPRGPGWRIDRVRFEGMLREAAGERGAILIAPGTLSGLARHDRDECWTARVHFGGGTRSLHARFVIDASGRAGAFLRAVALTRTVANDRLVCRFARLPSGSARAAFDGVSLVEAVGDGWWYSAALPDDTRLVAFHTDADLPSARHSRDRDGFVALLGETRWMKEAVRGDPRSPIARVAARTQWAAEPCGDDWCAVGDAAIAFDPLSSQGLFHALYTGLRGAEAAGAALAGDAAPLAGYRERIAKIRNAYSHNLSRYYRLEQRFADCTFWRRRHATAVIAASPSPRREPAK